MKNSARYVIDFIGPQLWPEVQRRIDDDQCIGAAVINAGDHADRVWAWSKGWQQIMNTRSYTRVALWLQDWGAREDDNN